jgi:hypothetical protein
MTRTDVLRQDHALLRSKVVLLESALSSAPYARLVFREKCLSFMRLLNRHMQREEPVLRLYYGQHPSARYLSKVHDHAAEHAVLRSITELFLGGVKVSIPLVILRVSQAIEQLREQIDEQERVVFPVVDELMAQGERAEAVPSPPSPPAITSSMSVNAIVQRYPRTRPVFEQLCVNRPREGYESVDEVAWRHGMDVSQVLEQLRQAAAFPGY